MAYQVEFHSNDGIVTTSDKVEGLPNAKHLAERGLQTELDGAVFARVIDVNGSGGEVASIRRDTMEWDQ